MRQFSVKGVLAGGITDIVATWIVSIPLLTIASTQVHLLDLPAPARTAALMKAMGPGSSLYLAGLLLGGACSVLGGYVAARIAKRARRLNGAFSAWLCVLSGLWGWRTGTYATTAAAHVAYLVLSPALGAFGGYLQERTALASSAAEPGPARAA